MGGTVPPSPPRIQCEYEIPRSVVEDDVKKLVSFEGCDQFVLP